MSEYWVSIEGQSSEDANVVFLPNGQNESVSTLLKEIVNSKLYPISIVSEITKITLDGKELKPRNKLKDLGVKEDSTFVLTIKESKRASSFDDDDFDGNVAAGGDESTKQEKKEEKEEEKKEENFKAFTVNRKKEDKDSDVEVILVITDKNLRNTLRDVTALETTYDTVPKINAFELNPFLDKLKDSADDEYGPEGLKELVTFLEKEFGDVQEKIKAMLDAGLISYSYLWYIYNKGKLVYGFQDDTDAIVGAEITGYNYQTSFLGKYFTIDGKVVKSNGSKFFNSQKSFVVPYFRGTKPISKLSVQPLNDEMRETLTERGKKFQKWAAKVQYLNYKGPIMWKTYWSVMLYKADGRCMLDIKGFKHMNPDYSHPEWHDNSNRQESFDTIPETDLWMTYPLVSGFSFSAKKWGELLIEHFTDMTYDDDAFHRLVLPETKKHLIKALVENQANNFSDIISGKGGGCIFLLHGSPGVGKTLTAESIAELLHRPLYSIGVGELGTTTDTLERKLRDILDISTSWNAVVLIDEADIFLEKRTKTDVNRNALVGIFLRLLEYHQGVLFLTTNRVSNFDPAFHSRISVALKYKDLEHGEREQVWKTLFEAAGIKDIPTTDLAKHDLNGRQIKNSIRLAQALAHSRKSPVTYNDLVETIKVSEQFKDDLEKQHILEKVKAEEEKQKEEEGALMMKSSLGVKKQ
eukprot:TRINITY_DN9546_c0_g1_i1.p1 TRINITY_DN9546_c0_g1~~TRINITY_DN9546_c0_g1_i1.p1  ORF type:complete len:694 (-),score=218.95 TRINITY_DN9546_c0_g1_i1:138-2219(-)